MRLRRWIGITLLVLLAAFVLILIFEKRYPVEGAVMTFSQPVAPPIARRADPLR
jgi:hypothetical protein